MVKGSGTVSVDGVYSLPGLEPQVEVYTCISNSID